MQRRTHYQGGWASTNQAQQQQQQQQQRGKSSNFFGLCELIQGVLELHTQHLPRRRDGGRLGRLGLEARANESSQLFFIARRGE
jgi:hypothetical protein